jgi:glycyl-tRNA synthetase
MTTTRVDMDTIVSLCKRRGFVYPSAEIYGGFANAWDYGPLGVEMRRRIREAWWRYMVSERDDMVGVEAAIVTNPRVWEASGHLQHFTDPMVDCRECKNRFRADDRPEWDDDTGQLREPTTCPNCNAVNSFTEARQFNMMLKTFIGPVEDSAAVAYMRPETAQGMFVNFDNVLTTTRRKLPFGIAQIGKSFRNEITPGNFIFRTREFEQMEMEYFCRPEEGPKWFDYWRDQRYNWYSTIGVKESSLRRYDHPREKLSHYSGGTTDVEFLYPFGWGELEGVAYRTNYDLKQHGEFSGKSLTFYDEETKEHIIPHVVEPAVGVDRIMLILLIDAYDEDVMSGERRVVLRLHPSVAPVQVAVLPLSRNEKLVPKAREVWAQVRRHFTTQYDDAQAIGRRYRRQDEIGTPLCVTVDFKTVEEDNAVTIRERDTGEQERVPISELVARLRERYEAAGVTWRV